VTWGPDHPADGQLLPPGLWSAALEETWPLGPLDAEERREQDSRFEMVRVSAVPRGAWVIWDDAYKRAVWYGGLRRDAERKQETLRVSCALWEEQAARGKTKRETEDLVETLQQVLDMEAHHVRSGWLTILRSDEMDAELHLEAFLADAQRARRRAWSENARLALV
jgi:hypothetical protein